MKYNSRETIRFLAAPDAAIRAVLFYGPDTGLVMERADQMTRRVAGALDDPFRVAELTGAMVAADPARLADEANQLALIGGARAIRLRDPDEANAAAITSWLANAGGDNMVIVIAGQLAPASKLRKLFEAAKNAAAIPCYVEEAADLRQVIGEALRAHGLAASPDALAYLAENLTGDRMRARREIEKLITYVGGEADGFTPRRIELADATAVVGDEAAMGLDDAVMAAASGDLARVQRSLRRLFAEGISAVAVLRAANRHFLRLHRGRASMAGGASARDAIGRLQPPVFFAQVDQTVRQLERWTEPALDRALNRLAEAEAQCKQTALPADAIASHTLSQLASLARQGRR